MPASYVERRCALRWPLVMWGLGGPAALVAGSVVLAVAVNPEWLIAAAAIPLFLPFMMGIALLYRNWPTGIRIDQAGVSIGAVGAKGAAARQLSVAHQNWGLFTCAWPNIRYVMVETNPARIREIKKSPAYWTLSNRWSKPQAMNRCMAGVLTAPFMRAALLIRVGQGEAVSPELDSAPFFANYIAAPRFSMLLKAEPALEWVVPTRRPEELRAFLASLGR